MKDVTIFSSTRCSSSSNISFLFGNGMKTTNTLYILNFIFIFFKYFLTNQASFCPKSGFVMFLSRFPFFTDFYSIILQFLKLSPRHSVNLEYIFIFKLSLLWPMVNIYKLKISRTILLYMYLKYDEQLLV